MDKDIILEFYKSHESSMLSHESQRANMTNIIISLCSIIIGIVATLDSGGHKVSLSLLIPLLGLFGYLFSLKHYERFSWHLACSNSYREKLHVMYPHSVIDRNLIRKELKNRFGWVHKSRLNKYWSSIHLVIITIGIGLLVFVLLEWYSMI